MRKPLRLITAAAAALMLSTPATASGQTGERILILGSSTTACAGQLSAPAKCYVELVKAAHPADAFTVRGRGGTYIAYGANPAKDWDTYAIPTGHDRVVIQLGINDWYVPVSPAQLRRDIDRFVIRVKAANPGARIAWVRTWMPAQADTSTTRKAMWADHGFVTADAMYYATETRAVGGPSPEAVFIDMGTTAWPRRSTLSGDGGWHYNDRGHAEIATAVNRWLG